VKEGEKQVEITISMAGGDLLSNVNRWRGQVQLGEVTAAELARSVKPIQTLGATGEYVELVGTNGKTILGVRADAGGGVWFIKLQGDSDLAAREKARFEAFVKSVRFK
jgi:hypothetical protein